MKVAGCRAALCSLHTEHIILCYIMTRLLRRHAVGRVRTWSRVLQQIV